MRDKLAERKKRMLVDQKRKQKLEMSKELLEQKKELGDVRSKVIKEAEHKEMVDGIQEQGADKAEKIIRAVSCVFFPAEKFRMFKQFYIHASNI